MKVYKQPNETYTVTIDASKTINNINDPIQTVVDHAVTPASLTISTVVLNPANPQQMQLSLTGGTMSDSPYKITLGVRTIIHPRLEIEAYLPVIET